MISFPNAKINIGLNITGKCGDGFHNIETIFYPVEFADVLEFVQNNSLIPGDSSLEITGLPVPGDAETNLVVKAYKLLADKFSLPGLSIFLHKIIPVGAGLGGGSSDAAFMLKTLNEYFSLNLKWEEMENLASVLGSDCAFFIRNKPVFAFEKGNKFKDIELSLAGYSIRLICPNIHIGTAEAYAGSVPCVPEHSLKEIISLPIEQWKGTLVNDFERTIFKRYPEIEKIKHDLYGAGAIYVSMSGSGSSVYGIFEKEIDDVPDIPGQYFSWTGKLK